MPAPKNPLGPAGETLRGNLRRIRIGRAFSYQGLSDLLAATGRRLPPISLRRIEDGTRRVDVDDLMALSVALDVSVVDLIVPATLDDTMPWHATARLSLPAGRGRSWIGGAPLPRLPMDAARLAELIRWMPQARARELARSWSSRGR